MSVSFMTGCECWLAAEVFIMQVDCKGHDLMELQALQLSSWSVGILKKCFPESRRREGYWQKYCLTIRLPSDGKLWCDAHNLLRESLKLERRRRAFWRRQQSNTSQKRFAYVSKGPYRFLCNNSDQICNAGLLKTAQLKSILRKNKKKFVVFVAFLGTK